MDKETPLGRGGVHQEGDTYRSNCSSSGGVFSSLSDPFSSRRPQNSTSIGLHLNSLLLYSYSSSEISLALFTFVDFFTNSKKKKEKYLCGLDTQSERTVKEKEGC